jgi:type IV pilus assembly protein PilV
MMSLFFRPNNAIAASCDFSVRACLFRGFTLVEVLMAVLVLALALTGLLRLHLTALQAQRQSGYRMHASQLAADMAGMIRGWSDPGDNNAFLLDYRQTDVRPPAFFRADGCLQGRRCGPAEMRRFAVAYWLASLTQVLPMARVTICRDATPWDISGNRYQWRCSGSAAGIVIKIGWRREAYAPGKHGSGDSRSSGDSGEAGPQLVLSIGEPGL